MSADKKEEKVSIEEITDLISKFTEKCGDDQEKLGFAKRFADDLKLIEGTENLKKSERYNQIIEMLEESNKSVKDTIPLFDLDKVTDAQIRQSIADYQATMRCINTLKGPKLEDVKKKLEMSILALEEEAKVNGEE